MAWVKLSQQVSTTSLSLSSMTRVLHYAAVCIERSIVWQVVSPIDTTGLLAANTMNPDCQSKHVQMLIHGRLCVNFVKVYVRSILQRASLLLLQ